MSRINVSLWKCHVLRMYRCISIYTVECNNYHRTRGDISSLFISNAYRAALFLSLERTKVRCATWDLFDAVRRWKFMRRPVQLLADQDILYAWRVAQMTEKVSWAVIMSKSTAEARELILGQRRREWARSFRTRRRFPRLSSGRWPWKKIHERCEKIVNADLESKSVETRVHTLIDL